MKKAYFILALLAYLSSSANLLAQAKDSTNFGVTISADLVSRYNWRGKNLSNNPAIQPTLEFTYKKLAIGTWASYTTTSEPLQEVDAYISYTAGPIAFTIFDYCNLVEGGGASIDYFDYRADSTAHTLEAIVESQPFGGFPLAATVGVFFFGNDRDAEGKNQYSTYFQLAYPFTLRGNAVNIFCGATPAKGYYADKSKVVNLGVSVTREVEITEKFKFPMVGTFGLNPAQKYAYFVLGISL